VSAEVRPAAPGDAAASARLLHDFNTEFSEPTPGVEVLTQRVRDMLASGELTILLAGAGPDGLAQLRYRRSVWTGELDAYLEELYVVPHRRGRGIGRALLRATLATAREAGATRIELGTEEDDTAARALYESCGFTNRANGPDGPLMFFYEREL
jgi:ribosomal protein S18 acetylase RimI-like enzyme